MCVHQVYVVLDQCGECKNELIEDLGDSTKLLEDLVSLFHV